MLLYVLLASWFLSKNRKPVSWNVKSFRMIDGLFLRVSEKDIIYGHIYLSFVVYDLLALPACQGGHYWLMLRPEFDVFFTYMC